MIRKLLTLYLTLLFVGQAVNGQSAKYKSHADLTENKARIITVSPADNLQSIIDELDTHNMTEDIIVELEGGIYRLDSTLKFFYDQSGSNGYRVIIRSKANELARISGGIPVTGWTAHDGNIIKAKVPDDFIFRQLYVNDEKMPRAEHSHDGNTFVRGSFVKKTYNRVDHAALKVTEEEAVAKGIPITITPWNNLNEVEIRFHTTYRKHKSRIHSVQKASNTMYYLLSAEVSEALFNNRTLLSTPQAYDISFENALEFVDKEGEWYLDEHTHTLYYYLKSGQTTDNIEVIAPKLERLVHIEGSENLCFFGLLFEHSTWLYPSTGIGSITEETFYKHDTWSNSKVVPPAIYASGVVNIQFERNIIRYTGGSGIFVDDNLPALNIMINGNVFHQTAANAINFCRKRFNPPTTEGTSGVYQPLVTNNYFYEAAFEVGTNLFAAHYAYQLEFSHNEVYKNTNMALGLGHGSSVGNLYRFNVKYNSFDSCSMEGVDIGVIHLKHPSDGSRIVENFFNNSTKVVSKRALGKYYSTINDPFYGNIYIDNFAEQISCKGNVHKNVSWNGFQDRIQTNNDGDKYGFEMGKHLYWGVGGEGTGVPNYLIDDYQTENETIESNAGLIPEYVDIKNFIGPSIGSIAGDRNPSELKYVTILADDRDDETYDYQIKYTGDWTQESSNGINLKEGGYRNTYSSTTTNNDEVSVTFTGTAIAVIMPKNDEQGVMEVFVDGVSQGEVNLYSDTYLWQETVFEKGGLTENEHILTLKKISGTKLIIDGFEIQKYGGPDVFRVVNLSPRNGEMLDSCNQNLEIIFSHDVTAVESRYDIIIYNKDGSVFTNISATDASQVSVDGSKVTISPDLDFHPDNTYNVVINGGLFEYSDGKLTPKFGGDSWTFRTPGSPISTEDLQPEVALTYFPNPVNGILTISANKEINTISVYSLAAKMVKSEKINKDVFNIDLSGLEKGVYLIKAMDKKSNYNVFKIIYE